MNDVRILILHPYRSPFNLDEFRDRLTDETNRSAPANVNVTIVLARDAITKPGGGVYSFDEFPEVVTRVDDNGTPVFDRFIIPVSKEGSIFVGKTTADIVQRVWRNQPTLLVNTSTLKATPVGAYAHTDKTNRQRWAKLIPQEPCANSDRAQLASLGKTLEAK
jgi:hypothetical protein